MSQGRRLAAILAADVAGYSRLMGADEEGTHDIFGDGVNAAARLEALAEPDGICISRMVRDQIRDKLAYPFEDIGEQSVKNIARPVRVYTWGPAADADLPAGNCSGRRVNLPDRRCTAPVDRRAALCQSQQRCVAASARTLKDLQRSAGAGRVR
jgi:hypothetical protein